MVPLTSKKKKKCNIRFLPSWLILNIYLKSVMLLTFRLLSSLLFDTECKCNQKDQCKCGYVSQEQRNIKIGKRPLRLSVSCNLALPPYMLSNPFSSAISTPFLNSYSGGDSFVSLGNLLQCFTNLSVKNFFPIANLRLPWNNLGPFSLIMSPVTWEKRSILTLELPPYRSLQVISHSMSLPQQDSEIVHWTLHKHKDLHSFVAEI